MSGGHATPLNPQGPRAKKPGPPKGSPKQAGSGRKPGGENKISKSVKAALVEAFEKMGGVPSLVRWGKRNPGHFYRLWLRLLPLQMGISADQPIAIVASLEWLRAKLLGD